MTIFGARGALQIQDRSPQLRPVTSECICDWLHEATGLIVATGVGFSLHPRYSNPIWMLRNLLYDEIMMFVSNRHVKAWRGGGICCV